MKFAKETFGSSKLYPIVDSFSWVKKLLEHGVSTIQLRIKNRNAINLENEIKQSIECAKRFQARLYINDYWELAIRYQAYGVHLGQEDLDSADLEKIYLNGLRLGISTHNYAEVNRAKLLQPSYLAIGPIFPTTSKVMPFAPQGTAQLKHWRKILDYPLVAIGGINLENINEVLLTHVDAIAMISAITQAINPTETIKQFLNMTTK